MIFFIVIPKIDAVGRLHEDVTFIWRVLILILPDVMKAPVEVRLLQEGAVIEVLKEVSKSEVEVIPVFIVRVNRGIFLQESLVAHAVIQPPLLLVGEHLVG